MGQRSGFNADQRAKERESGPVVIGGVTYHPARLTNRQLRQVRRLSRAAGQETRRLARETEEYDEALRQAREDHLDDKEAREQAEAMGMTSDSVAPVIQDSLVEQLRLLLVTDGMQPPEEETLRRHLEEDIDFRDVDALMGYLLGNEDPTRPEETTTASAS